MDSSPFVLGHSLKATTRGYIHLAANNRLYPNFCGFLVKLDCAMHIAMVSHRHGTLAKLLRAVNALGDLYRAIKDAVLGMQMEMAEVRHLSLRVLPE